MREECTVSRTQYILATWLGKKQLIGVEVMGSIISFLVGRLIDLSWISWSSMAGSIIGGSVIYRD